MTTSITWTAPALVAKTVKAAAKTVKTMIATTGEAHGCRVGAVVYYTAPIVERDHFGAVRTIGAAKDNAKCQVKITLTLDARGVEWAAAQDRMVSVILAAGGEAGRGLVSVSLPATVGTAKGIAAEFIARLAAA